MPSFRPSVSVVARLTRSSQFLQPQVCFCHLAIRISDSPFDPATAGLRAVSLPAVSLPNLSNRVGFRDSNFVLFNLFAGAEGPFRKFRRRWRLTFSVQGAGSPKGLCHNRLRLRMPALCQSASSRVAQRYSRRPEASLWRQMWYHFVASA